MLGLKFLIPALASVKIKVSIGLCGFCAALERWGDHFEEWLHCKPVLQATEDGLIHEDGGPPVSIGWHQIRSVAMVRRAPFWRTGGNREVWGPPYWLAIHYKDDQGDVRITAWPRQITGGLFALRRFAATMKQHLAAIPAATQTGVKK